MKFERPPITDKEQETLRIIAVEGVRNSVIGLSQMIGEDLEMQDPSVDLMPILELPNLLGAETEVVGIYLTTHGELEGQYFLIFPFEKALEMVDLLMMEPIGTTTELDSMGMSALAEAGNLTGAFFLNKVADLTGLTTVPSTPTVLVDIVGAILNILITSTIEYADHVMVIRTTIRHREKNVQANFWFVPHPASVSAFTKKAMKSLDTHS